MNDEVDSIESVKANVIKIHFMKRKPHGAGSGTNEGIPLAAMFSSYSFHRLGMLYGDFRRHVKSYVLMSPFRVARKT